MVRFGFTGAEALAHGLPPVDLTLDGSGLMIRPLPGGRCYLSGSGPPGGPHGISLEPYAGTPSGPEALRALAGARFAGPTYAPGQAATIALSGRSVQAFTCAVGAGHARALHLLALIPARDGADAGVLLDYWCAAGAGAPLGPDGVLGLARHGDTLRSLRVDFPPG